MTLPPTVAAALRAANARLAAAGVPDAARDSRLLMAHALGIAADRVTLAHGELLSPEAAARFATATAARAARQPVSQIIGTRAFWGRAFHVTRDVLDPRPETESLIAAALVHPFSRVLDLGTGSGAILVTLLAERCGATGVGTDISPPALCVARENAVALGVADRAAFLCADWFAGVSGTFDLITANPPYISEAEFATLAPEPRLWEPRGALTPGGDGLDAYRALAGGAGAHLAAGGAVMVEIGPTQAGTVTALFQAAGFAAVTTLTDLDARPRVVVAKHA